MVIVLMNHRRSLVSTRIHHYPFSEVFSEAGGIVKAGVKLDTPTARRALMPEHEPYWNSITVGKALGYRKPPSGPGVWWARIINPTLKLRAKLVLAEADDPGSTEGIPHREAWKKAEEWFRQQEEQARALGVAPKKRGAYSVNDAMDDYLRALERAGKTKSLKIMVSTIDAHIRPALGGLPVEKLTVKLLEGWLDVLANSPRRKTGLKRDDVEYLPPPSTDDEKRRRKDSANRVLTNLNAALNLAVKKEKYHGPQEWRRVERFKGANQPRTRFLSLGEQQHLVNGCDPTFRPMIQAGLHTGARYGELCRLQVSDFDPIAGTVFIQITKSGRSRYIALTQEAIEWFAGLTKGRQVDEPMFEKQSAIREGCVGWLPHDQMKHMARASKVGNVMPRVNFHELRHTYASTLMNAGVPLVFLAAQLGHTDTKMVEKVYGHFCPDAKANAIRSLVPALGISEPAKLTTLKIKKASP